MANLTDQQEIFCHEIVKGKSQFAAYQVAYPSSTKWKRAQVDSKASTLAAQEKVKGRIERLRAPILRKTTYEVVEAMEEAGRALELAMSTEQVGAAVAAIQLRAKLHGLLIERKEVKVSKFDDIEADDKQTLIETMKAEIARRKVLTAPDQGVTDVEAKGG